MRRCGQSLLDPPPPSSSYAAGVGSRDTPGCGFSRSVIAHAGRERLAGAGREALITAPPWRSVPVLYGSRVARTAQRLKSNTCSRLAPCRRGGGRGRQAQDVLIAGVGAVTRVRRAPPPFARDTCADLAGNLGKINLVWRKYARMCPPCKIIVHVTSPIAPNSSMSCHPRHQTAERAPRLPHPHDSASGHNACVQSPTSARDRSVVPRHKVSKQQHTQRQSRSD